jgi:hypothetical protein
MRPAGVAEHDGAGAVHADQHERFIGVGRDRLSATRPPGSDHRGFATVTPVTPSTVSLQSDALAAVFAPGLGGRVLQLRDLKAGRDWLWRNDSVPLEAPPPGASYDDVWQGGFEELFPNDASGTIGGLTLPDHGELWAAPWEVMDQDATSVVMETIGTTTGSVVRKAITLAGSRMTITYTLSARRSFPYLFKLHPAMAIDEDCTLDLPGGRIEQVSPGFGSILGDEDGVPWPGVARLDVCRPAATKTREFVYVKDLAEGWCGVTDARRGCSLRIDFDRQRFPYCWLFITYGGWRDHNVVVLEPCTTHPKDLAAAVAAGTTPWIAEGERVEFSVDLTVGPA